MKKLLIGLLIMGGYAHAKAQKLLPAETDKFNGSVTQTTTNERIYATTKPTAGAVNAAIKKVGDTYVLALNLIEVNGVSYYSVSKSDSVMLKLSDNSILTLPSGAATSSAEKLIGANRRSESILYYLLSAQDIQKLITSGVTAIRISTSKGNFDYDITPKYSDIIKKELALLDAK